MGIVIDKLSGNPMLVEIKEADLTTALQAKVNQGKVAGIITTTLPTSNIISDKVYEFAGANGATVTDGTIKDTNGSTITTLQNGDSLWYNPSTTFWYRIPFQSLANYYTKSEIKVLPNSYMSNSELIESANGEDYEVLVPTYDANGNTSSATVKWRDGATGIITITRDTNGLVSSYAITHVLAGEATRTVTQPTVTRDSNGNIISKPALTIA